jgi:hypothetical protein
MGVRGRMHGGHIHSVLCGVVWCGVVWCGVVWCSKTTWGGVCEQMRPHRLDQPHVHTQAHTVTSQINVL